jgi:hypothetical protein
MNSPGFSTFVFSAFAGLFLFSCTRAVDNEKTSITITIPNTKAAKSAKLFVQNLTGLNLLPYSGGEASILATGTFAPEPADPVDEYPDSCYMIAVSYPEPAANRNFCGINELTGVTITAPAPAPPIADDVSITPTYYFSQNFKGLFDPNRYSTVELTDIVVGPNRTFVVVAVPTSDVSTCVDLLTQPMEKGLMLKPRIIGKISQDIQVSGNEVNIKIDQTNPTDSFDDCIITDTRLNFPNANKMVIDQEAFPFNFIRGYSGTNGFICQPLIVGARSTASSREVPGAINFDSPTSIFKKYNSGDFTLATTYNTHQHCIADTAGTGGTTSFTFPRNQPSKKRWVKISSSETTGTFQFRPYTNSPEITTFDVATFTAVPSSIGTPKYVLDHQIPRVLQLDTCYRASTTVRNVRGGNTGSPGTILTLSNRGTAGLKFYTSDVDCANESNVASIDLPASSRGVEYWVKAPSTAFRASDAITYIFGYSGTPTGSGDAPYIPTLTLYASVNTQVTQANATDPYRFITIDQVGYATAYPKVDIPNDGGCYPVTIGIANKLGANFASNFGYFDLNFMLKDGSIEHFDQVPLRYEVLDIAKDGITGGYSVSYGNNITSSTPCGGLPMTPADTVAGTSGTVNASSNETFYTLFLQTNNDGAKGRRRMQLYYGGTASGTTIGYPVGQVDFELTTPD